MAEGIPNIDFELDPAKVVTVPIDSTLRIAGQAADAKAVGDALAEKADRSDLATAVRVNDQKADKQGEIILLAQHIPLDANGTRNVKTALEEVEGRTGANIRVNGSAGARTIEQELARTSAGVQITGETAEMVGVVNDSSAWVKKLLINERELSLRDAGALRSVNGMQGDASGNVRITNVETANNLLADDAQSNEGRFILRASGGGTPIATGDAWLAKLRGNMLHTGAVAEQLTMEIRAVERQDEIPIAASIDAAAFKAAVSESTVITLVYTSEWSVDPEQIGVTVSGTPVRGDTIVVAYVKANRGTITPATPASFISTGWNLYSHANGHARVVKYSEKYGFRVGGAYTGIAFSETLTGTREKVLPVNGCFSVPSDGYVWVTGGDAVSTCVYMTWSDWTEGYEGDFEPYRESVIDISTLMAELFPYGLLTAGVAADEIDFSLQKATVAIERLPYSDEAVEALAAEERDFVVDTEYIYVALEAPREIDISVGNRYAVSDHGMELIRGTSAQVYVQALYGQNLRDKLRTDVVTLSQHVASKAEVKAYLGLSGGDDA